MKTRAAASGMSLSDFIKRDLERAAARPSLEEIDARIARRRPSGLRTESVLTDLREVRDA